MILITDIGKDLDDAIALTYAIIEGIPLKAIIATSKDAEESAKICKNIIDAMSNKFPKAKEIKVYAGSTNPLKKRGESHSNTYKGDFSKGPFKTEKFDPLKIEKDDIVSIGGLTDLLGLLENNRVKRVMFMGQALKDRTILAPDMKASNFRYDPFASEATFQFQDKIPFGFIGKDLAYKVPLTKTDLNEIGEIDHPVARFLKEHAFISFDFFKNNVPELYERIYKGTDNLSYCYDPLTMLAIKHPELFTFEKFNKHRIGVGIKAKEALDTLLSTLKEGLSK